MTPTIEHARQEPRLTGAVRRTPFHHLHEPAECPASCATCREEADACTCSYYGHGFNLTRVHSKECAIHA